MPFDGTHYEAVKDSQLKKDLLAAKMLLITQGWRPRVGRAHGPHCAITAIAEVVGGGGLVRGCFYLRTWRAERALQKVLPSGYERVARYNDSRSNVRPILDLFDKAIAIAD